MNGGDEVVLKLNRVIEAFTKAGLPVFFTRDWHPPNHISFKSRGGPWPPHCVQGAAGADFHPDLDVPSDARVISKGNKPDAEAYSGFQGTDLEKRLKRARVDEIFIGGLATDYCIKESCLDARRSGFEVNLLRDCVRAVNVKPGDGLRAVGAMKKAGAKLTTSKAVLKRLASTQQ